MPAISHPPDIGQNRSSRQQVFILRRWMVIGLLILVLGLQAAPTAATSLTYQQRAALSSPHSTQVYRNPLEIKIPGGGLVESCADPTIIRGQAPQDINWYMYCTTDPLNGEDRNSSGGFNFRLIPMLWSVDLVHWQYAGDAFDSRPGWVADDAGLWAPEIQYFNGQYYLYYTASWSDLPGGGSAIGVATSNNPLGPWVDSGGPVVEPHDADCCPGERRWVFDPALITDDAGQKWIYYGSYFGGVSVRKLSADGLSSDPASQVNVAIPNRYEGGYVVKRDGYYYLFVSATDCCRGPLTGYSVFVGRSSSPTGPFVDKEGVSFMAGRVGGTPVISMNGNRWVGPGHNAVFTAFDGQDWFVYHAIDRGDPYFGGATGFTKRPALMDPLDWIDGWPTVRGGLWASDTPQQAPAAQPGDKTSYRVRTPIPNKPGELIAFLSDEFDNHTLSSQWSWVREPDASIYSLTGETFQFNTQAADLHENSNNASVLVQAAPQDEYLVEAKVSLSVPPEGCCFNFVQAGLVIYGNDDNYIKHVHVSIWETRQTEFAKEVGPVPSGFPRYGNTVGGPPNDWTYLRVVKRLLHDEELYTAYSSRDGVNWVRSGTWTHNLGQQARIGLVSMGGPGFQAEFDYVRVYNLTSSPNTP